MERTIYQDCAAIKDAWAGFARSPSMQGVGSTTPVLTLPLRHGLHAHTMCMTHMRRVMRQPEPVSYPAVFVTFRRGAEPCKVCYPLFFETKLTYIQGQDFIR